MKRILFSVCFLVLFIIFGRNHFVEPKSTLIKTYDIYKKQLAVFFGADFYDLADTVVADLKLSPEGKRIAFTVWDKESNVFHNLGIVNSDGTDKKLLVREDIDDFAWFNKEQIIYKTKKESRIREVDINGVIDDTEAKVDFFPTEAIAISENAKARIHDFQSSKYKGHYGVIGGTVKYEVVNYVLSPVKTKIAFLIEGEDGHDKFYPAWYICDEDGDSITLVDTTLREMSNNVVWLSENKLLYVKDARLWEAEIK